MWPRESLARHPRWSCGALPATTWTSPTSLRCRPWKHPRRPRRPRSRRGRRPCPLCHASASCWPCARPSPKRPGHHRRRRAGRPAAGARLGSHCRTAPPAPQAPVAAVAAARVPALPGPGGPPETGAPCLRAERWFRGGGGRDEAAGTAASRTRRSRPAAPPIPPALPPLPPRPPPHPGPRPCPQVCPPVCRLGRPPVARATHPGRFPRWLRVER
jgi:hypothetical protein